MTAHEFDRQKHFGVGVRPSSGVGIPDYPTEEEAKRCLMFLVPCVRQRYRITNAIEIEETRGTPGELVPTYCREWHEGLCFLDSVGLVTGTLRLDGAGFLKVSDEA